jgi:hypothetical protein
LRAARSPAAVVSLGALLAAASAQAVVDVTAELPVVAHVDFDPRHPPDAMPGGGVEGGGVCHSVFELEANIVSSVELLTPTTVRVYPADFAITTRLKITIYAPHGAPDDLRAHEEGHRTIAEHYYRSAESAARNAAASVERRPFQADGIDRAAAERAVAELVLAALKEAFMQRTHARSAAANARYDAITKHGLDRIGAADAVVRAIAQDP